MNDQTIFRCFECNDYKTNSISRYILHVEKHARRKKAHEQCNDLNLRNVFKV